MSQLGALPLVIESATRRRDAACSVLQATLVAQQAARVQLGQLQDYARDTTSRWGMRTGATLRPELLYHQDCFMERLEYAAGIQRGVVGEHAYRVDAARQALLEAQLRLSGLRQVLDRRRHALQAQQQRREQQQADEHAARAYRGADQGLPGRED
ncbi:flagellar export protein FliJ [Verminephrobacter aporrectodeae subsp. tuberculatae]|uniref:Flagellar FliJ protein n=1 Tax=Verminephrobacter aporrectodeae subsp. tuberculatae TaxID=1110392 RepID=A0ABT3KSU3_9BURK|nr:flagellar export protein FliJ [Verminephrobacter aporrectodeae]MCW5321399.1 flagellar export protein FliJ [Verminephrobacter aporrectodeae subsp. tuberculatae]MCW5323731.1 flagellar export protein FliJ [Verminephrobacter aporrectodeae subsp. tuberculatae]